MKDIKLTEIFPEKAYTLEKNDENLIYAWTENGAEFLGVVKSEVRTHEYFNDWTNGLQEVDYKVDYLRFSIKNNKKNDYVITAISKVYHDVINEDEVEFESQVFITPKV